MVVVVVVYRFYSSSYISTRRIVTAAGGGGEGADPPIKSALSRLFLPWHALLFFSGNLWLAGERVASFWQQGAARLRGRELVWDRITVYTFKKSLLLLIML